MSKNCMKYGIARDVLGNGNGKFTKQLRQLRQFRYIYCHNTKFYLNNCTLYYHFVL